MNKSTKSRGRRSTPAGKRQKMTGGGGGLERAPVAMNRSAKSRAERAVSHSECERVATVAGSVSFASVGNYAINPGIASSFPWLSGVAQHYERYRIDSLLIRYKNLKGTSTDGNIIMSFDYDTLDDGPSTAVLQTQSTVYLDGAPWRILEMRVPTDGSVKYIRTAAIAGADLKTYDFGRVWVSAEGCADTSDHGYLEFEYRVSLFEKQSATVSGPINRTYSQWNLAADTAALSASAVIDVSESLTTATSDAPTNASGSITLPVGFWNVQIEASAKSSAVDATATIEIRKDGAPQAPPVKSFLGGYAANDIDCAMASCVIESDGTTTVDLYFNKGAGNYTFLGDACRISTRAI